MSNQQSKQKSQIRIDFLGKNKLSSRLQQGSDPRSTSAVSHMSICTSSCVESQHWRGDFLIGHFEARGACACADPCPLLLHAPPYNKSSAAPTGDGSRLLALLSGWAEAARRLEEVSVNNAIGSRCHTLRRSCKIQHFVCRRSQSRRQGLDFNYQPEELHHPC